MNGRNPTRHTCPTCNGTIKYEGYECPMCDDGTVDDELWLEWCSVEDEQEQLRYEAERRITAPTVEEIKRYEDDFRRIFGEDL